MTTYLFGSAYSETSIRKTFKTDDEAFEYAHDMTDGPDCVPIWKVVNGKLYSYYQENMGEGKWIEVDFF